MNMNMSMTVKSVSFILSDNPSQFLQQQQQQQQLLCVLLHLSRVFLHTLPFLFPFPHHPLHHPLRLLHRLLFHRPVLRRRCPVLCRRCCRSPSNVRTDWGKNEMRVKRARWFFILNMAIFIFYDSSAFFALKGSIDVVQQKNDLKVPISSSWAKQIFLKKFKKRKSYCDVKLIFDWKG